MQYHQRMKAPVYLVKPKYIFKHPFDKYDFSGSTNRQTQNQELTDYFNYGFNEDTMSCYGKFVKRMIEVLDQRHNLEYFNEPSELMKLNDEIPMDFGGFCKFHDPSLVNTGTSQNFHTGEGLMQYLVLFIMVRSQTHRVEYPLIELVKQMYKEDEEDESKNNYLFDIVQEISNNNERKYQEVMKKVMELNAEPKPITKKYHKEKKEEHPPSVKEEEESESESSERHRSKKRSDNGDRKHKKIKKEHYRERKEKRSRDKRSKDRKSKDKRSRDRSRDRRDRRDRSKERRSKERRSKERRSKERRSKERNDKKKHTH